MKGTYSYIKIVIVTNLLFRNFEDYDTIEKLIIEKFMIRKYNKRIYMAGTYYAVKSL